MDESTSYAGQPFDQWVRAMAFVNEVLLYPHFLHFISTFFYHMVLHISFHISFPQLAHINFLQPLFNFLYFQIVRHTTSDADITTTSVKQILRDLRTKVGFVLYQPRIGQVYYFHFLSQHEFRNWCTSSNKCCCSQLERTRKLHWLLPQQLQPTYPSAQCLGYCWKLLNTLQHSTITSKISVQAHRNTHINMPNSFLHLNVSEPT